jgi:tRNA(fMet)-specific endonuclease VapC
VKYMLDTNIVSGLMKDPTGSIARRIEAVGEVSICISAIVAAELRYGAEKKGSSRLLSEVDAMLGRFEIVPFGPPADRVYGRLRAGMERQGISMSAYDLLIAAQAIAAGYTLVTDDGDFLPAPGLVCENWLRL